MAQLAEAAVLLTAAVIAVPIARLCGLGAVIGYLIAGAIIGPMGLGFIAHAEDVLHFAEFGVVLLLFIIGLELQPSRLWTMRRAVFGLGVAQMMVTGVVLALVGHLLGLAMMPAVLVGLTLALSSTAFALQTLAERGEMASRHGRAAFSILLLQDLAAILLIAVTPLLSGEPRGPLQTAGVIAALEKIGILIAVALGGRYFLRHAFRIVARARVQEVFTAAALLTVIATTLLMEELGLSAALGAFLAGVLLADSEYRHALEADLEPFKGLLLGLFFIAVGMSLNLALITEEPAAIAALVVGLILIKMAVLFVLGRSFGLNMSSARSLAIAVSQGGEFAFVIFGVAAASGVLDPQMGDRLIAAVTLSMAITPILFALNDRAFKPTRAAGEDFEQPPETENQVIIAGFGRFGQIIARILRAKGIPFTALDASSEHVDFVARYGNKIYYGDASRLELLKAAKADHAVAFVLAIDDVEASVRTARVVTEHFPDIKVFARARNRQHVYRLMELGVTAVWRETFLSATDMAGAVLKGLGLQDYQAEKAVETFRKHDERRLEESFGAHKDDACMQALAKKAAAELEELFAQDAENDRKS